MNEEPSAGLTCPFCGSELTDRIDVGPQRFLVFRCMFTPPVDPSLNDAQLAERLRADYDGRGDPYFRGMCDRLHGYVTRGPGARILTGSTTDR